MIVFEYPKYLKQIKRDGIATTDRNARAKIIAIMENLIANPELFTPVSVRSRTLGKH